MSHFKEHSSRHAAILDEVTKVFIRCSSSSDHLGTALVVRKGGGYSCYKIILFPFVLTFSNYNLSTYSPSLISSHLILSTAFSTFLSSFLLLAFHPSCFFSILISFFALLFAEQGILVLVVQFLNLVTGAHSNSKLFWTEVVPDAMRQRFGNIILDPGPHLNQDACPSMCSGPTPSIDPSKRKFGDTEVRQQKQRQPLIFLWEWCTSDHTFLFTLLPQLCSMTGIHLSTECQRQLADFEEQLNGPLKDRTSPMGFYEQTDSGHNVTNITDTYRFHKSGSRTYNTSYYKQHQQRHTAHFEFVIADVTEILPVSTHSSQT